ncbi:hypothetical protein BTM25_53710 [Actinomadura rubteroloni]|uniref:Secreted protein n=1 Tax=Actinomadura rubteroloni TaxID=1926885 RepID=A0A2P4UBJ2_9ACTN|nr:hypothetical protein [Actinomadura rubteroloni]POM22421.1 hypothetical protein BTM25_53710 [Actinomadura rubteroloni]
MPTALMVVVIVIAAAVLAGLGYLLWRQARTHRLRSRFGTEYDRAVERHNGRAGAEHELMERERHHRDLDLRELEPARREEYRAWWTGLQERFVDEPVAAVADADKLVTVVMTERGYPTGDFDANVRELSVEHGRTLDHYRRGHALGARAAGGGASTEDLRQAMVHYRALVEDLLAVPERERADAPKVRPAEATRPDSPIQSAEPARDTARRS